MAFLYYAIGRIFFQKKVYPPQMGTIDYYIANFREAYINWLRSELEREDPVFREQQEMRVFANAVKSAENPSSGK